MTMMAVTRVSESSVVEQTFNAKTPLLQLRSLLTIEKSGGKTKFKWNGSLDELKSFSKQLNLHDGTWSFVPGNGSFHVLKASKGTLTFYPNTKTLNVQGAQQHKIKKKNLG